VPSTTFEKDTTDRVDGATAASKHYERGSKALARLRGPAGAGDHRASHPVDKVIGTLLDLLCE
jgi:hypothetical protein